MNMKKKPSETLGNAVKNIKAWAVLEGKNNIMMAGLVRDIDYCDCGSAQVNATGFYICKKKFEAVDNSMYLRGDEKVVPCTITYTLPSKKKTNRKK